MNNFSFIGLAVVVFNCFASAAVIDPKFFAISIYNPYYNKCLSTSGVLGSSLFLGDCDGSGESRWLVYPYFDGHYEQYRSEAYPDYCISLGNGNITLEECEGDGTTDSSNTRMYFTQFNCLKISNPSQVSYNEICRENEENESDWYISYRSKSDYNDELISVYFYNASKNKCLRTTGTLDTPLTYGACDHTDNTIWKIPATHDGNFHSKINLDYCLSIENGNVSLKECRSTTNLYRDGNFIKSRLFNGSCIGSSEINSDEISLKDCNENDQDQIWFFNAWDPSDVAGEEEPEETSDLYFYNVLRNKCLRTTGSPDSTLTYGDCDNSINTVFEVPLSHNGYYRSKVNPDYCLSMEDGKVSLSECNENTKLYRDGNFIKSPSSDAYCIGSSGMDSDEISSKECNENDPDQIWYFNLYDPSAVIVEEPEPTSIVYFYNAYKNKCLTSDGVTVFIGNCFNNDDALWEIPISHKGYYRHRSHPNMCLNVIDGEVSVSECSEATELYRDGNFIRSPLSDNHCIGSLDDNSIKYLENCIENHSTYIWYFNIWTPPTTTEAATSTVTPTEAATSTEIIIPTEVNFEVVPTEVAFTNESAEPTEIPFY